MVLGDTGEHWLILVNTGQSLTPPVPPGPGLHWVALGEHWLILGGTGGALVTP